MSAGSTTPIYNSFTGEEFFHHEFPHERSDLSHWRKRLGDKLELLLAESLRLAHASGALRSRDLARVTVDTMVQPKNITFSTDAKLLHAAIKGLDHLADKHGVRLQQYASTALERSEHSDDADRGQADIADLSRCSLDGHQRSRQRDGRLQCTECCRHQAPSHCYP